jgi:CRP-like cAMP-binding protein
MLTSDAIGSVRLLPDGLLLFNRLLGALPESAYATVGQDLRLIEVHVGEVLHDHGVLVRDVFFPNGGVFSVTNQMQDGRLVEVATIGIEGMVGVSVFLGDRLGTGTAFLQVPGGGPLPAMAVEAFNKHMADCAPFRDVVRRYTQVHLLQVMQCTACNALHNIEERCSRWLLQTHDRVEGDDFVLKHEFLATMLGTTRPSVTIVMGTLQRAGLIAYRHGRIRITDRKNLEQAACECYQAIVGHHQRLGMVS